MAATKLAEELPAMGPETIFDDVYMNLTPGLRAQRKDLHELVEQGAIGTEVGDFPL